MSGHLAKCFVGSVSSECVDHFWEKRQKDELLPNLWTEQPLLKTFTLYLLGRNGNKR